MNLLSPVFVWSSISEPAVYKLNIEYCNMFRHDYAFMQYLFALCSLTFWFHVNSRAECNIYMCVYCINLKYKSAYIWRLQMLIHKANEFMFYFTIVLNFIDRNISVWIRNRHNIYSYAWESKTHIHTGCSWFLIRTLWTILGSW